MSFNEKEAEIWEKQNLKEKEQEINKRSYQVYDEEDDLEFLDQEEIQ